MRCTDVDGFEDPLPKGNLGLVFGQVRRDQVGERAGIAHVVEDPSGLLGQVGHQPEHLAGRLAQALGEVRQRWILRALVRQPHDVGPHVGLETQGFVDPEPPDAVEHHGVVARAETDDFHQAGQGADLVEIVEGRLDGVGVALGQDADERALLAHQLFDQVDAAGPPNVDRDDRHREEHRVAERDDRNALGARWLRRCGRHTQTVVRPWAKASTLTLRPACGIRAA